MITSSQAYVLAYSELADLGVSVDGWVTSRVSGNGEPPPDNFSPQGPSTEWSISWHDEDGAVLAAVVVDAETGALR